MEKILLIEDNEALRENTAEILTLANYEVSNSHEHQQGKKGRDEISGEKRRVIDEDIVVHSVGIAPYNIA